MDFLFIKAHFPAHNSPLLGYTTPGYASKKGKKMGVDLKIILNKVLINIFFKNCSNYIDMYKHIYA